MCSVLVQQKNLEQTLSRNLTLLLFTTKEICDTTRICKLLSLFKSSRHPKVSENWATAAT